MPSVSLLRAEHLTLKSVAITVVRFFKEFVNNVVISVNEKESKVNRDNGDDELKQTKKVSKQEDGELNREPEEEADDEADDESSSHESSVSLFPNKHNVDTMLFGRSSVIPCSLDIGSLDTPMTISVTPEGNFSCKLNKENFDKDHVEGGRPFTDELSVAKGSVLPISPQSNTSATPMKEDENTAKEEGSAEADNQGNYVCHYCDARFRIRGYLTRHIKKHAIRKAYHCPFFNPDAPPESRCHNSGGFSRRDTYKTHLKARHFIYPKGVKPQERNKSSGHCSQCCQYFENTDQWVEQHIETGECKGLPEGYLKNIKSERTSGRLRMIKTSNGHSRFISTAQSVVEPKVLFNKDALEAMAIVAHNTNRLDILSKYGNNKIMMSSDDFKGAPKPKRKYTRRKGLIVRDDVSSTSIKNDIEEGLGSFAVQSTTPLESEVSPYDSNCASEYMDDETALNEISSSINPSPADNQVLEIVPSNSSESSQECQQGGLTGHGQSAKVADVPNIANSVKFNDPFSVPLDMEQCCFYDGTSILDTNQIAENVQMHNGMHNNISINNTLLKQFDLVAQAETHLRENEQYLNFYNYKFKEENQQKNFTA